MREVLFAAPTARTPRFDAYTPGSYGVDKMDLVRGLADMAAQCKVSLQGVLVLGPVGPLWAYYVVPFITDGRGVRVNALVIPHARITSKGTGTVQQQVVDAFFRDIAAIPGVRVGVPTWPDSVPLGMARDFSYDLLLVQYAPAGTKYHHGRLTRAESDTTAQRALNSRFVDLMKMVSSTYPDSAGAGHRMP